MNRGFILYQEKILKILANKVDTWYLSGGTALSLFYFNHRQSEDLDFFTQHFERSQVLNIVREISETSGKKVELIAEQLKKTMAQVMIYKVTFAKDNFLKIDFVEDYLKILKPLKIVNGTPVLSLEDIYLRKIYAITGFGESVDIIGRKKTFGGRQEAKDFYDLYCLSHIFLRLSDFATEYCDSVRQEGLIRWFRTYDRIAMKTGLLELKVKKRIDYQDLEHHFKKEIDRLIEREIEFL